MSWKDYEYRRTLPGHCSRCGRKWKSTTHKTCDICRHLKRRKKRLANMLKVTPKKLDTIKIPPLLLSLEKRLLKVELGLNKARRMAKEAYGKGYLAGIKKPLKP